MGAVTEPENPSVLDALKGLPAITLFLLAWGHGHRRMAHRFGTALCRLNTGMYQINTCDTLNACGSKIWVYGQCQNLLISNDPTGADFYAAGGCDNGAIASLLLAGGQDYYIRIRYEPANCDTTPIHFTLSYIGAITGCTDPTACNYEPLATVSDTCIYPGDPACPQAPDLVTRQDVFRQSLNFRTYDNPDACAVEEGCIRGLGVRHIIEFSTYIENIGEQDYHIGQPQPISIHLPRSLSGTLVTSIGTIWAMPITSCLMPMGFGYPSVQKPVFVCWTLFVRLKILSTIASIWVFLPVAQTFTM